MYLSRLRPSWPEYGTPILRVTHLDRRVDSLFKVLKMYDLVFKVLKMYDLATIETVLGWRGFMT